MRVPSVAKLKKQAEAYTEANWRKDEAGQQRLAALNTDKSNLSAQWTNVDTQWRNKYKQGDTTALDMLRVAVRPLRMKMQALNNEIEQIGYKWMLSRNEMFAYRLVYLQSIRLAKLKYQRIA